MHVMTVVGARPQFVKAAVLSRLIRKEENSNKVRETLVHTGQHYDENMSEVFFRDMEIPKPDVNLNVGSGNHGAMTGRMLAGIEELILERKPDVLLVYGDTNSTLAGALAASKLHVQVAHVEAGLRSFMMAMPEEQNRRLTDHLSSWLFCPTEVAIGNLNAEGIKDSGFGSHTSDRKTVKMTGDIMLDASNYYRQKADLETEHVLGTLPQDFYLITIHRAENTDNPERLRAIVGAINSVNDRSAVFPIHPRTRKILDREGLSFGRHVHLLDPVGYFEMLRLEGSCSFVLTDSGGVQKEAYFFHKPCVTLRDSTEWIELVDSGWNVIVGADPTKIERAIRSQETPASYPALYGTGNAGELILTNLLA